MNPELEDEYRMLLKTYKKLGGEDYYDNLVKKGKTDEALESVRSKIKTIELDMSSHDLIECAYKFNEKK